MTARAEDGGGSSPDQGAPAGGTKRALRRALLARRRERPAPDRAAATAALAVHLCALAAVRPGPVACYLPIGTEPGGAGPGVPSLPDTLLAAGHEVLAPVVPELPGPLDWTVHHGPEDLAPGPLGVVEPTGPRLGPAALASAGLVVVPALAVDRRGRRLGRGGGFYDRTLPLAAPGALLVVPLYDGELRDEVPAEEHDVAVGSVVLPRDGVVHLSP
ncbi:5-formyltetrahydrofolate cyclo-ligase [Pseudonocardia sp. ICBG1293]|uniref:5-formyltetrahydrofolate cyclo-ligase n=1 Tax=Pseudonocardia sp. ICBG1293 TaxID=2844382 RepID=UPI001CCD0667|nr:5-formyltetrahydrofolate cyclo-ligase [Pseudonocardia sp. ICBG1293]